MANNQKRSRRFADRVLQVAPRQGSLHPELGPLVPLVTAAAQTLIERYDERAVNARLRERIEREANSRVAWLRERVSAWVTSLERTLEVEGDTFGSARVPDDVLGEADRLVALVQEAKAAGTLPFADEVLTDVEPVLLAAREAWHARQQWHLDRQMLAAAVRDATLTFDKELVTFRRALRVLSGTNNLDYRKLKDARSGAANGANENENENENEVPVEATLPANDNPDTERAA